MALTVARVYSSRNGQPWSPIITGAVCFIKDFQRRSYYISAFDMDRKCLAWEQELYNEMTYKNKHIWFHTFEADQVIVLIMIINLNHNN